MITTKVWDGILYSATAHRWMLLEQMRHTAFGAVEKISTLGVGVTKPISSVPLFSNFSALSNHTLAIEYHVYIWQVSPQLSCGDTCQIWMWFEESNIYFCQVKNFAYEEINERSFSNPTPGKMADRDRTKLMVDHKTFSVGREWVFIDIDIDFTSCGAKRQ